MLDVFSPRNRSILRHLPLISNTYLVPTPILGKFVGPGIISLVILRCLCTKLFLDSGLAEGRNSATGSKPKDGSSSSDSLEVLPIKESYFSKNNWILIIQGRAPDASAVAKAMAGQDGGPGSPQSSQREKKLFSACHAKAFGDGGCSLWSLVSIANGREAVLLFFSVFNF